MNFTTTHIRSEKVTIDTRMQEIVKAQKNVELFFAEEKDSKQVEQIR